MLPKINLKNKLNLIENEDQSNQFMNMFNSAIPNMMTDE